MKNISRWTNKGCSYRTIQRFFASPVNWLSLNMVLLRLMILGVPCSSRYVLAVDEVVEKKAGKQTWGVNWFYSSIAGKVIRSVSNHVISLVDTEKAHSCKYGTKIEYKKIPEAYLISDVTEEGVQTKIYQIKGVWTKKMPYLINVIILTKTILESNKTSRVLLFSTDLELEAKQLIKFYSLRFQIEFNFRDAKQYFGLADFKNIKEQQLNNAVGLALFMDNVSLILIEQAKSKWKEDNISIQDLKAYYRAEFYLESILNTLEIEPTSILNNDQFDQIRKIGAVNRIKLAA